jgi:hypothetical protein
VPNILRQRPLHKNTFTWCTVIIFTLLLAHDHGRKRDSISITRTATASNRENNYNYNNIVRKSYERFVTRNMIKPCNMYAHISSAVRKGNWSIFRFVPSTDERARVSARCRRTCSIYKRKRPLAEISQVLIRWSL